MKFRKLVITAKTILLPIRTYRLLKREQERQRERERTALAIKKIRKLHPENKKGIFTAGYYHTGTRWVNELIIQNTPENHIYSLEHQHNFISDDNSVIKFGKHRKFDANILAQRNCVIIYMVRDFESWMQTFLNQTYEVRMVNDIASESFGWPSMNVYDLYCHIIQTNIDLLRASECNYIIANLKMCQKTNGLEVLELLEGYGFEFVKPFKPILKHTKDVEEWSENRMKHDISKYKHHSNVEVENTILSLLNAFEYKLN